jgi:hypothetical protein
MYGETSNLYVPVPCYYGAIHWYLRSMMNVTEPTAVGLSELEPYVEAFASEGEINQGNYENIS